MPSVTFDEAGRIVYTDPSGNTWTYLQGDIAWMLAATALVWLMTPGVGYLYSGFLQRRNALSMIFVAMAATGVVTFQWWLWGFSLAFSDSASPFIGDLKYVGLRNVFENPSITSNSAPHIPSIVYCIFQLTFATITPVLAIGAIAERGRLLPSLIFIFIWSTLVYDPIACWTWNSRGWANKRGVLDFAGGTVVHINSGTTSLAISMFLKNRRGFGTEKVSYPPNNTTYIVMGTVWMWFGWFGFNGGSALGANLRAAQACFVTTLSASIGGLAWMMLDCIRDPQHRLSIIGYCSGAISALVAITPGSGYVGAPAAGLFGLVAGIGCNLFTDVIKSVLEIDDTLDIFSMHTIGGLIGNILTAFFAQSSLAEADGSEPIRGGFLDRHYKQLGWQLANSMAGLGWSFCMTMAILWTMHFIPGLSLRRPEPKDGERDNSYDDETKGTDELDMNELAYDYVHVHRDISIPFHGFMPLTPGVGARSEGHISPRERPTSMISAIQTPGPAQGNGTMGMGMGMPFQQFAGQQHQQQVPQQYQQMGSDVGHSPARQGGVVNPRSRPPTRERERDNRINIE